MATPPPSFPLRLPFGTLAIYPRPPQRTAEERNAAAFIVSGVKRDAVTLRPPHKSYIQIAIDRLVESIPGSALQGFFDPAAVLVPLPGSSKSQQNSVSAPRSIAKALIRAGLGRTVVPALARAEAIRKSAYCKGNRPVPAEHFDSMSFTWPMHEPAPVSVLLIDDVLTKGSTALGAAAHVLATFPMVTIRVFALARTDDLLRGFYDPCAGLIVGNAAGTKASAHAGLTAAADERGTLF